MSCRTWSEVMLSRSARLDDQAVPQHGPDRCLMSSGTCGRGRRSPRSPNEHEAAPPRWRRAPRSATPGAAHQPRDVGEERCLHGHQHPRRASASTAGSIAARSMASRCRASNPPRADRSRIRPVRIRHRSYEKPICASGSGHVPELDRFCVAKTVKKPRGRAGRHPPSPAVLPCTGGEARAAASG